LAGKLYLARRVSRAFRYCGLSKRDKHKDQVRPTLGHLIQKSKAEASTPIGGPRTTWPPVSHFIAHLPRSHVIFQTTHLSSTTPPRTLSISPKVRNTTISSAKRHSGLSGISSQPVSHGRHGRGRALYCPSRADPEPASRYGLLLLPRQNVLQVSHLVQSHRTHPSCRSCRHRYHVSFDPMAGAPALS
jgi:hypothetical protein